jgi:hypothetical protein
VGGYLLDNKLGSSVALGGRRQEAISSRRKAARRDSNFWLPTPAPVLKMKVHPAISMKIKEREKYACERSGKVP